METDDAAAKLRIVNDAIKDVRRRSKESVTRMLQVNDGLAAVDPWELPPLFVTRKEPWSSTWRTHSGYWQEKQDDFTAIRSPGDGSSSSSSGSPSYQGVKRTMEFYRNDGTETDWIIHDYNMLEPDEEYEDDMFLQEDMVFRKVFQKKHFSLRTNQPPATSQQYFSLRTNQHQQSATSQTNRLNWNCRTPYEAGSGCGEFPTASAAPYGESEVWQHFTRIKTKGHGLVYAACHRCDKVLKAHSSNGTTHLKRHLDTCSCNSDPSSTTADQEILRDLRAMIDQYEQEKNEGRRNSLELNSNLSKLDPWDLQPSPCYITSSLGLETHQGRWKEIDKERAAICISRLPVPRYVGLKRTLKFHLHNGTKTDWIMLEYHQVDEYMPPDLLLEGTMVFRKVFQIENVVKELERMLNKDDDNGGREEEVKAFVGTLLHDCFLGERVQGDQSRPGKRKRSEVWLHFTKIYTTNPGRVYAVCHYCDRGYNAHPKKHGTNHLKRHNKTCSSKHRKL